jgi:anthraniloyl-CoA monooxygenase
MRVAILGAGPAGLYLAILMKKASRRHEIEVIERNAPDATFGWGVVFSEETLGALRDADEQTYTEITDTFARWETVDIRHRGTLLRSRGNRFSAIARKLLLEILQRRCRELGVELRFGVEIEDPDRLDADLVVGADGVNSVVRRSRADAFGARVEPEGCWFAWFGTDLVFDAFTFIFRHTEHGLFQVHAYPFDDRSSTFIVECPEDVWRRAGLDELDEAQSIAFCEELFAADLDGHRLLSNRSRWTRFLKVRNRSWHDGRFVLVGDAAHTAHFTIGSGTKLAMEDSVALARAFVRHGDDVEAAVVDYELERQPVVERFQEAASDSASYFVRVGRTTHLQPMQFAFNLLTRSGRITHTNLAQRDPGFVRVMDAWFAGDPRGVAPPPMFTPLRLGGLTLPNRIVRSTPGGAGLVLSELVAVSAEGRVSVETPVLGGADAVADMPADADRDGGASAATPARREAPLADWVAAAHDAGAAFALQLGHAGRRGATRPSAQGVDVPLREGAWPLLSASPVGYAPFGAVPKEADAGDLARVRDEFAASAARAAEAGVDVLELDFAHGYLVASFLSPLTNRRDDAYGADRLKFPLEVLEAVRAAWPDDRVLAVRLSVTDWARGGLTVDDGIAVAQAMAQGGAQLVHVVAGQTIAGGEPRYRRGFLTALSERVRTEARVPTLVGGWLTTPDQVDTIVAAGRGDLCILELERTGLEDQLEARPEREAVAVA